MSISPAFMKAILSMDSYNRGYNEGVKITLPNLVVGSYLGNYQIISQSNVLTTSDEYAAGFYGIAYQYGSQIIISYRGTDEPIPFNGIGGDIANGWGGGSGYYATPQAELAFSLGLS